MFKQNGSTGTLVILIVVLVLILGGGAYYLTQNNNTNIQPVVVVNPTVVPTSIVLSPTIQATPSASTAEKTYKDSTYNYSLEYPNTWTLTTEKDWDNDSQVYLQKNTATKTGVRYLPTIYITLESPYSTSGAVCANQGCIKEPALTLKINGKNFSADVIKGVGINNQLEFYTLSASLEDKEIKSANYSQPTPLKIFASYKTPEEAQEISQILSSIKY